MIEKIQKYKIIITLALAAVGLGFLLGGSNLREFGGSGVGGVPVLKIGGRTYEDREFAKLGSSSFELVSTLARAGDFGLYQFLMTLSAGATTEQDAAEKFFIGRILLHQAKEEFGIFPSAEEVSGFIRKLRAFADKDGQFSEDLYRKFVDRGIGRLGLTEGDLQELAADVITSQKINAIIGAGLVTPREIVAQNLLLENQQVSGTVGRLSVEPFEAKIQPTDEQVKAFWEERQDAFMTDAKRKFTYLIATPATAAEAKADPAETAEVPAKASDDEKKAIEAKREEAKAKRAAATLEAQRAKQLELDTKMDDLSSELDQEKGANFEDLAKANGWELKTTALFGRDNVPKELDLPLRSSSRRGKVVDELFRIQEIDADPLSKFTQPIAVGENQWLIARIDGQEKPRRKTFEEAKAEASSQYVAEKALEAMKSAANDAASKIKAELVAGKPFADAAKAAGLSETKEFSKITSSYRPDPATEPSTLFESARNVDPGSLAELIIEKDRAFIVLVAKREVIQEPDAAKGIEMALSSAINQNETFAFASWLAARTEAANVERLYKQH